VSRRGPKIVSDENATLHGGDRQDVRVTHAMQFRGMGGEEVNRRFASYAAGDDRVVEAGVRGTPTASWIALRIAAMSSSAMDEPRSRLLRALSWRRGTSAGFLFVMARPHRRRQPPGY
jgi:hypothetical protein